MWSYHSTKERIKNYKIFFGWKSRGNIRKIQLMRAHHYRFWGNYKYGR